MNKRRRADLESITTSLSELLERLESLKDDEEEYYENMPDSIQAGVKGESTEAAINALELAQDSLDEAISYINEAVEGAQ